MQSLTAKVLFQGQFTRIPTYVLNMDTAQPKGGMASEALASLRDQLRQVYGRTEVTCDPYAYPAALGISGPSEEVARADTFVKAILEQNQISYTYQP